MPQLRANFADAALGHHGGFSEDAFETDPPNLPQDAFGVKSVEKRR